MVTDPFAIFCEGIALVLRRWTALQIAIDNDMAGVNSELKRTELYDNIVSYFAEEKVTVDELENSLYWYFEDEFKLQLEDESSNDVSMQLVKMYQEVVVEGNAASVQRLRELSNRTNANASTQSRMVEETVDGAEDPMDAPELQSVTESTDMQLDEPAPPKYEPVVDDEGFTLVQKGRGKKH